MIRRWALLLGAAVAALFVQLQLQISREKPALSRLQATVLGLRFSLARWLAALLIPLLALLGRVLLTLLAKRLGLEEFGRELVVWLRVPLSIFLSRLIVELAAGRIIRLQVPTAEVTDAGLSARVGRLCAEHGLKAPPLSTIHVPGVPFAQVKSAGTRLFLSSGIQDALAPRALDFLILRELAAKPLGQLPRRLVYLAAVAAVLVPPYLLGVQFTPYCVRARWILPTWGVLFAALFGASTWLRLRFVRNQEIEREDYALRRLGLAPEDCGAIYEALGKLNRRPPLALLTSPFAPVPRFAPSRDRSARLGRSLTPLALFAALSCAAAFFFLKPRFDLREASKLGDTARIAGLLDAGYSPDSIDIIANGQTPLIAAASGGRLDAVRLLLERGADPNEFHPLGLSPLLPASEKGDLPMVSALVERGANVNFKGTRGLTPLMLACAHGKLWVASYLVGRGARVDERSKHGSTALLLSVQAGQLPAVVFLIKNGANPNARDVDGDTALGLARRKKLAALAAFLEKNGAK